MSTILLGQLFWGMGWGGFSTSFFQVYLVPLEQVSGVVLEVDASFIYLRNGGVGMEERSLTRYLVYQVPGPRSSSPLDVKLCQ
jgi:hypothetical protein